MTFSDNAINGILAAAVLVGMCVALIVVPHEYLRPIALTLLAVGVMGVFGVRQYLRRLHALRASLSARTVTDPQSVLDTFLSKPERAMLGIAGGATTEQALQVLRSRESYFVSLGTALGTTALLAFLLLVYLYDL